VRAYLDELVARLRGRLGERLVGAWLFGSAALGDFDERRSDLDVQAVATERLPGYDRRELAAAVAHDALPCPVRGLELVLYAREDLGGPTPQLNLNSGPRMAYRLDLEPAPGEWFWFAVDVAIGREHGRALAGPPAHEVFPALGDDLVARALRASLTWHGEHDAGGDGASAVLGACRAWAWAVDRRWLTKADAARWAAGRLEDPEVVERALALRDDPDQPPLTRAQRERVVAAAAGALGQ
jgi:hypothetical protein